MDRVILLAGGSSLKEGIDSDLWNKIKDEEIWGCNSIWEIMPYLPKKLVFVDKDFFKKNIPKLQKLYEAGVHLISRNHHLITGFKDRVTLYESTREAKNYHGKDAINKKIIFYGAQGFAGTFLLSLAVASNFKEIYLLGFDYGTSSLDDKQTHVYQDVIVEKGLRCTGAARPDIYLDIKTGRVKRDVNDYNIYLREKDIKIWNVSMDSNIPSFEKLSYEQFYEKLKT